jgi:D-alanyl-D-alanine dipeptidase
MTEAVAAAGVEVEFSNTKIVLDFDRVFYLREGLIDDFIAIARDMNARGWVMKVEDGYRSTTMQKYLARKPNVFGAVLERTIWECGGAVPSPDFVLRRVTSLCATIPKIGTHMSASAIDISVLSRDDRSEIDRGGPYIEMSELTPMTSPFVSLQALENRLAIREVMERHGFMAYPYEFWHYNKGDCYAEALNKTGKPARYGAIHWNAENGTITPVENPTESLQPLDEVQREIEVALARLRA